MTIQLDMFFLSIYMEITYAFIPAIRCMPFLIRIIWRILPVLLVVLCVIKSKKTELWKSLIHCVFLSVFISLIRFSSNSNGTENGIVEVLLSSISYWITLFQGTYIIKYCDPIKIRKIIRNTVFIIVFSCLTTILGNLSQRGISRDLMHEENTFSIYIKNIGGYGFIYGIALMIPWMLLYYKRANTSQRIIRLMAVVMVLSCVAFSQFMTAFAISIIGLGGLLKYKTKNQIIILCLAIMICLGMLFLVLPMLLVFIRYLCNTFGLEILWERIQGIIDLLSDGTTSGDVYARVYVYRISINHFLDNPLFGLIGKIGIMNQSGITAEQLINQEIGSNLSVGRHSDFIDLLGGGGLVAFIPFWIIIRNYEKMMMRSADKNTKVSAVISFLQYVIYGITDHAFSNFEVSIAVFLFSAMCVKAYSKREMVEIENINTDFLVLFN